MNDWEPLIRLAVAAAAGVAVGFERELHGHPAGMRTHTLVAVGAAMFTIAGAYGFPEVPRSENVDPMRLAAQVASGIGFIGAGAILRDGMGVRGITTAATLWLVAALGVAAGAGIFIELLFGTVLILAVLTVLRLAKPIIRRFDVSASVLKLQYEAGHGTLGSLIRDLNDAGARIQHLRVTDENEEGEGGATVRRVRVPITIRDTTDLYALVERLEGKPEVRSVELESAAD